MIPIATQPQAQSIAIMPPVGGWDTQSALSNMPPQNAERMVNWFPETERVRLRPVYTSHATGLGASVETLLPYVPMDGTGELYGCANGSVFDVTSAGAVGAAVVTGQTNDRYQHVQMGTAGGHFLLAFNGADTPLTYNGTTWGTYAGTGPTAANLVWGNVHHRRLFIGEVDSLSFWYLAVNAITGAATEFPLYSVFDKGGYIMAMGTWTRDSGSGADDLAVFLSSEGQVAVYQGTDPGDANNWSLIGVFQIGRPIGRRCMLKFGGDLIMVTDSGFVAASTILTTDRAQTENVALSKQIQDAVNDEVADNGSLFGWQPALYTKGQMLIFNIPQSTTTSHQFVFNSLTNAPCKFTGINAICWGLKNDEIYLGKSDGTVHLFDDTTAFSDNGTAVDADLVPAFNYLGAPHRDKLVNLVEPIFNSIGDPCPRMDLMVDYVISSNSDVCSPAAQSTASWGSAIWGVDVWGQSIQAYTGWRGLSGYGRAVSLRIRLLASQSRPSLIVTNYVFTMGGYL